MGFFSGDTTTTETDVHVDVHSDPTINVGVDVGSVASALEGAGDDLQTGLKSSAINLAIAIMLGLGLLGLAVRSG